MKRVVVIFFLFMAFSLFSFAQNLVSNSSFEDTIHCPTAGGFSGYVSNWAGGFPAYFSKDCFDPSVGGVPQNVVGYQYAYTGNAYAGIYTFCKQPSSYDTNLRDYLQDTLLSTLKAGTKYYVTFFVSLADSVKYACNNISAFFSDSALQYPVKRTVKSSIIPQVTNDTSNHLTDKINWTKVSGNFVAKGGEKFVIIGNFKDDFHSDTIFVNSVASKAHVWTASYYYIDDVVVTTDSNYADSLFPTAVQNISKPKVVVNVYPNPGNGVFTIEEQGIRDKEQVEIYNVLGEKIYSSSFSAPRTTLDLSGQPSGIYLYRIVSEKGEAIATGKLILQKQLQ